MDRAKQKLGKDGENIAKEYLISQGYKIIETNFRCKSGEIDIIAEENDYIVFVEVKTRTNYNFGYPLEAITRRKKQSIIKAAKSYVAFKRLHNRDLRIDVLEIIINSQEKKINLIRNAVEEG